MVEYNLSRRLGDRGTVFRCDGLDFYYSCLDSGPRIQAIRVRYPGERPTWEELDQAVWIQGAEEEEAVESTEEFFRWVYSVLR